MDINQLNSELLKFSDAEIRSFALGLMGAVSGSLKLSNNPEFNLAAKIALETAGKKNLASEIDPLVDAAK